jgi:LEA14-like dessication related protein
MENGCQPRAPFRRPSGDRVGLRPADVRSGVIADGASRTTHPWRPPMNARTSNRTLALRRCLMLAVLGAVMASGCTTLSAPLASPWKTPKVALVGLTVKEVTLARQTFGVRLAVHNPNDRALPIRAMTWRLQIEGQDLAEGAAELEQRIPAFGDALVDMEAAGNLVGLTEQAALLATTRGPVAWKVSGTVTLADGLLPLPYWYSGRVDAKALIALGTRR